MAKAYKEGTGWSVRLRMKGQDVYLSGYPSERAANKAAEEKRQAILGAGKMAGRGPWNTTVAQAMQRYGLERLPYLKGARQVADRLNRYLRFLKLDILNVQRLASATTDSRSRRVYFRVELVPCGPIRKYPRGVQKHREAQLQAKRQSDWHREQLARSYMADVTTLQMQSFVYSMVDEGYEAATVGLERAALRKLFNHAQHFWAWPEPRTNPATGLDMPTIENKRDRVLTNEEWQRLSEALADYGNPYALPALLLLLETTMRSSEPLLHAQWSDMDFERCILSLQDGKTGRREVPLSPGAMDVMRALAERRDPDATDPRILPLTYEALKAAWDEACEQVGIDDVHIHDLRHTGATRYAFVYKGNMPLLKVITGHQTDSQLSRYINFKAEDVARIMHGLSLEVGKAPAGMTAAEVASVFRSLDEPTPTTPFQSSPPPRPSQPPQHGPLPTNVIQVEFGRREAA